MVGFLDRVYSIKPLVNFSRICDMVQRVIDGRREVSAARQYFGAAAGDGSKYPML